MLYCNRAWPVRLRGRRGKHGRLSNALVPNAYRVGIPSALFALTVQLICRSAMSMSGKIAPHPREAISLVQAPDRDGRHDQKHHSGADDFCAICATISLLANSALPTASSLLPPVATEHRWLTEFATTRISFDPFVLFQARAPPAVLI